MRLLLVRHGESVCGASGIVGGDRGCTGLTERGFAQARALRDRLRAEDFRPDVILASTLPRARQTAEVVAEPFGLPVDGDPQLVEFIPGEIDGTAWADFEGFDVTAEPHRPLSPGGDSMTTFRTRISSLLDRVAATHDGRTVMAFCHGGPIGLSLSLLLADGTFKPLEIFHTSITEWVVADGVWKLIRFNDAAHVTAARLLVG